MTQTNRRPEWAWWSIFFLGVIFGVLADSGYELLKTMIHAG